MYFAFLRVCLLSAVVVNHSPFAASRKRFLPDGSGPECRYVDFGKETPSYIMTEERFNSFLTNPGWLHLRQVPSEPFLKPVSKFECPWRGTFYLVRDRCKVEVTKEAALAIGITPNKDNLVHQPDLADKIAEGYLKVTGHAHPLAMKAQCLDTTYYVAPVPLCTVIRGSHLHHPGKSDRLPEVQVARMISKNFTMVSYGGHGFETKVMCGKRIFLVLPTDLVKGKP